MQNTLFKQSVVYTILYASIFTGCGIFWGTKKEQKNDTKTLASQPEKPIKEKKSDQPVAYGFSPTKSSPNLANPSGNNGVNQDIKNSVNQDIKEEIEEELQKEEQRLKKEEKWLEEGWTQNGSSDGSYSAVEPTASDLPPPPYDPSWATGSTDANPDYDYYAFDEDDVKDLDKNPSWKRKYIEARLGVNYELRAKVPLWLSQPPLYELKEKLQECNKVKDRLVERITETRSDKTLSSESKAKEIKNLFIKIKKEEYEINYLKKIIAKVNKKNNKSDDGSNEKSMPYPTQSYATASPSAPPLYPDLSD